MLTLGFGLLLAELANSAGWLTGGVDGLQGMHMWPLLGIFHFDLYGYTAYAYALAVLFVLFVGARRLIHSPFGLALRGIRENWVRMPAIGADSRAHIRTIYTISAAIAGICRRAAGADDRNRVARFALFDRSAELLVMLVLGRRRTALRRADRRDYLYGGARPVLRHTTPQYWFFWIGLLLIAVVMFLPNGVLGGLSKIMARWGYR